MKVVFALTNGRSGTRFLKDLCRHNLAGAICRHEPYFDRGNPTMFGRPIYDRAVGATARVEALLARKRATIEGIGCDAYVETSHAFLKSIGDSALECFPDLRLFHLVRNPLRTARSEANLEQHADRLRVPGRRYRAPDGRRYFRWSLTGLEPIFAHFDVEALSLFQRYLIQWIEIENRAMRFLDDHGLHDRCATLRSPADLNDPLAMRAVFERLELATRHDDIAITGHRNRIRIAPTVITGREVDEYREVIERLPDEHLRIFRSAPYTELAWAEWFARDRPVDGGDSHLPSRVERGARRVGVRDAERRIGLVCPEIAGHLNPLTTLGMELRRRGHSVALIGGRPIRPFAERAGLGFVAVGVEGDRDRQLADAYRRMGDSAGFAAMVMFRRTVDLQTDILLRDLPPAIESGGFDGLIVDQFSPGGVVAAERDDWPLVVACNALAVHWPPRVRPRSPATPGWRLLPAQTWARLLGSGGARYYERAVRRGRVMPGKLVMESEHGLAWIAQQPAWFDVRQETRGDRFHYTGPWHGADRGDADVDFPWDRLDDRPLIYASTGTLHNNLGHLFESIVAAVRDLPVQLVLSAGGGRARLRNGVPSNVTVVEYAPQLALLDRARLAITHAGMNSVLECLARGVPMLCVPVAHDQPHNARRVEWLGAGECLTVRRVTPRRLRERLARLLRDERCLSAARSCRDRLREVEGISRAAAIVEEAFATREPVLAGREQEVSGIV